MRSLNQAMEIARLLTKTENKVFYVIKTSCDKCYDITDKSNAKGIIYTTILL